jgi:quercetin dioxygenase-like cupin family protein
MRLTQHALCFAVLILMTATAAPVSAQDSGGRKELRRVDFSGTPGMEVVLSLTELKPGDEIPAHFHHGIEAGYVLEGGMAEVQGKPPFEIRTGTPIMKLRDIPHGGVKIVGDKRSRS